LAQQAADSAQDRDGSAFYGSDQTHPYWQREELRRRWPQPPALSQRDRAGRNQDRDFEKGGVRIHFEEAGSGFPLLVIGGGGLNSTTSGLAGSGSPFNPMQEFEAGIIASLPTCATPKAAHPCAVAMEAAMLAPKAEVSMFSWKQPNERTPLAIRQIQSFLRAHRPTA
jgi:hypothetical protein